MGPVGIVVVKVGPVGIEVKVGPVGIVSKLCTVGRAGHLHERDGDTSGI